MGREGLIRVAVGLEDPDDGIADFASALEVWGAQEAV